MIAFIKGTVADIEADKIVLENNNMGYNVFVPSSVINKAQRTGSELKLYTYLSVREDAMTLFGFLTKEELELFKKMINVSGIGPKGALGILSTLNAENLRIAIISGDAKAIAKSPGIGAKTASKLILELKDKVDLTNPFMSEGVDISDSGMNIDSGVQSDAMEALIALGYTSSQALNALKRAYSSKPDIQDAGELIKLSLKNM